MEDYYRVRFRKLLESRGRSGEWIEMPVPLQVAHVITGLATAIGIVLTCALGRSPIGSFSPWFSLPVVALPVAVTLWLGFSEQQAWTRPLIVLLLALATVAAALSGLFVVSAALAALAIASASYLYGSARCRAYYSLLREQAVLRISSADLKSWVLVPLYTGAVGLLLGATLGYFLVTGGLGPASGLGAKDFVGLICVMVLLATLFAIVGRLAGEALVARWHRAA